MNRILVPKKNLRALNFIQTHKQFLWLRRYFDTLQSFEIDNSISQKKLPEDADAFFVGVDPSLLSETYSEALEMVIKVLSKNRKFKVDVKIDLKHIRSGAFQEAMLDNIFEDQGNPVVIYPAQLGEAYYGLTPGKVIRRMRVCKFGLSTFQALTILLTHHELLVNKNELAICCVGDEYCSDGKYNLDSAPVLYLDKDGKTIVLDKINKGTNWNNTVGCATGYYIP